MFNHIGELVVMDTSGRDQKGTELLILIQHTKIQVTDCNALIRVLPGFVDYQYFQKYWSDL